MAAFYAKVIAPLPATDSDMVWVVNPQQNGGVDKTPCRWPGGTPPTLGQKCVMVETDELPWALGLQGW